MSRRLSCSERATLINKSLRPLLIDGLKGIEKESLRITREGSISSSPHPLQLGSALTHPNITTDYSERCSVDHASIIGWNGNAEFFDGLASICLRKYQ